MIIIEIGTLYVINKNNNYSTTCLISCVRVSVYVYCFLMVPVAEGLGVALFVSLPG